MKGLEGLDEQLVERDCSEEEWSVAVKAAWCVIIQKERMPF